MRDKSIRLDRLRILLAKAGSYAALARTGPDGEPCVSAKYASQLLAGYQTARDKKPRDMGDGKAQSIERAWDLPEGWMDAPIGTMPGDPGYRPPATSNPALNEQSANAVEYQIAAITTRQVEALQSAIRAMADALGVDPRDLADSSAPARARLHAALRGTGTVQHGANVGMKEVTGTRAGRRQVTQSQAKKK